LGPAENESEFEDHGVDAVETFEDFDADFPIEEDLEDEAPPGGGGGQDMIELYQAMGAQAQHVDAVNERSETEEELQALAAQHALLDRIIALQRRSQDLGRD
jgi:hypothetical protein